MPGIVLSQARESQEGQKWTVCSVQVSMWNVQPVLINAVFPKLQAFAYHPDDFSLYTHANFNIISLIFL